jgi:hypothetical protein
MGMRSVYKQTDVGTIPSDWKFKSLESISKIIDSLHRTPKFVNEGYSMVRVTDIKNWKFRFK